MRLPLLLLSSLAALCLAAQPVSPPAAPSLPAACAVADAALARADLAAYRGWIKFLRFEAETSVARSGADSAPAREKIARLAAWVGRIVADPQTLSKLRGVQEWAYESPVDGSGQPFKLMIPTDYDPTRPAPLSVYMHGYTGDHLNHSTGIQDHDGFFELAVLGRSRGGGYAGLSQADVLQVLDYVAVHWRIDPARVHLTGGSMGGGATFKFGARFPHRFASGQITCGYVQQEPIGNLLTFPIYATHSDDDPVVPILLARGPLAELRRRGGQVIFDETTGYGHAAWDYAAGNQRSAAWAPRQVSPDTHAVRFLDFTAYDGAAVRCWWAEIAEWGAMPRPARFVATAGADNTFFVELDNVARLRVRLAESPFDATKPLRVVLGGAVPYEIASPLPAELIIAAAGVAAGGEAPARLHTPGGPLQVYDGSPLLIVYGTQGNSAANVAMRAAAEAASKSFNTNWPADAGEFDARDQVPHRQNLFGRLNVKADTAVTAADLARCNLVLIGTAAENTVVAQLAAGLPVRLTGDQLVCSDGFTLPAAASTVGLLHFNPLAPQRLIFWVASTEAAGYAAGATVPALASPLFIGADLLVTHATDRTLVATRSFDSRWRWVPGREASALVSAGPEAHAALARRIGEAVRLATGADFAIAGRLPELGEQPVRPGVTRTVDLASLFYGHTVDVLELTGAELLTAHERLAAVAETTDTWVAFQPVVTPTGIDPAQRYRVAVPMGLLFAYGRAAKVSPRTQWRAEVTMADGLARFLGRP
ncbi:MAG: hypothetical protein IPL39_14320 [Opitutaceae bacterium]|nr:hypothetical protein [Opitutaceae bacterium]